VTLEDSDTAGGFDAVFDDLFRVAYRASYRILGSREDAEDIAIEILSRASERWRRIEDHPTPWVAVAATNRAISLWRRHRRFQQVPQSNPPQDEVTAERIDLARALSELPLRQREVVVLRYLGDLSEADVSTRLACSPGTVKQHTSRGLANLRRTLGQTQEGGL